MEYQELVSAPLSALEPQHLDSVQELQTSSAAPLLHRPLQHRQLPVPPTALQEPASALRSARALQHRVSVQELQTAADIQCCTTAASPPSTPAASCTANPPPSTPAAACTANGIAGTCISTCGHSMLHHCCGVAGTCISTSQCTTGTSTPGLCSGPADIQCCTNSGSGPSPITPPTPTGNVPYPGIVLIKKYEGLELNAYPDPLTGGKPITIGYGSTRKIDGSEWSLGESITTTQAEELLIAQCRDEFLPTIEKIPTWSSMNDNQKGAVLSFAYNLGANFYGKIPNFQSISRLLGQEQSKWNDCTYVDSIFVLYRNPGSAVEAGLRRRREEEAALFCSGSGSVTPPAPVVSDYGTCKSNGVPGLCIPSSQCKGVTASNLCPGPADIKCCTGSCALSNGVSGTCMEESKCSASATTGSTAGCAGSDVCCTEGYGTCSGGECVSTSLCTGSTVAGKCPGPADVMCCVGGGSVAAPVVSNIDVPYPGVELIKKYEGLKLSAYPDPATNGPPITIGYGSTRKLDGSSWSLGESITESEAEELLITQIRSEFLPTLASTIPTWNDLSVNQKGAILSFAYNLGAHFYNKAGGSFDTITAMLRDNKAKWLDADYVVDVFVLYRNPGSVVEEGLKRRREEEGRLFANSEAPSVATEKSTPAPVTPQPGVGLDDLERCNFNGDCKSGKCTNTDCPTLCGTCEPEIGFPDNHACISSTCQQASYCSCGYGMLPCTSSGVCLHCPWECEKDKEQVMARGPGCYRTRFGTQCGTKIKDLQLKIEERSDAMLEAFDRMAQCSTAVQLLVKTAKCLKSVHVLGDCDLTEKCTLTMNCLTLGDILPGSYDFDAKAGSLAVEGSATLVGDIAVQGDIVTGDYHVSIPNGHLSLHGRVSVDWQTSNSASEKFLLTDGLKPCTDPLDLRGICKPYTKVITAVVFGFPVVIIVEAQVFAQIEMEKETGSLFASLDIDVEMPFDVIIRNIHSAEFNLKNVKSSIKPYIDVSPKTKISAAVNLGVDFTVYIEGMPVSVSPMAKIVSSVQLDKNAATGCVTGSQALGLGFDLGYKIGNFDFVDPKQSLKDICDEASCGSGKEACLALVEAYDMANSITDGRLDEAAQKIKKFLAQMQKGGKLEIFKPKMKEIGDLKFCSSPTDGFYTRALALGLTPHTGYLQHTSSGISVEFGDPPANVVRPVIPPTVSTVNYGTCDNGFGVCLAKGNCGQQSTSVGFELEVKNSPCTSESECCAPKNGRMLVQPPSYILSDKSASPLSLAVLSAAASPVQLPREYESLKDEWKVIEKKNFAVAFGHSSTNLIAISFAGGNTEDYTVDSEVGKGFQSADLFVANIMQKYSSNYKYLIFTGHSLGAVFAEVFAVKWGTKAITFESPGSSEIIRNSVSLTNYLAADYSFPSSAINDAKSLITVYANAPNWFNQKHVQSSASVVRVYTFFGVPSLIGQIAFSKYSKYDQHPIDRMLLGFDINSRYPTASTTYKTEDWPVKGSKCSGITHFLSFEDNTAFYHAQRPFNDRQVTSTDIVNHLGNLGLSRMDAFGVERDALITWKQNSPITSRVECSGNGATIVSTVPAIIWGTTNFADVVSTGRGDDIIYLYGGDDIVHDDGGNDVYLLPFESWGRTEITDIGGTGTILSGIIPLKGDICLMDTQCAILDYSNIAIRASGQFCLFMNQNDLIILSIDKVMAAYRQGSQATLPDINTVSDYLRIKNFQSGDFGLNVKCTAQQQKQQYISSNNADVCAGGTTSCSVTPDYKATQLSVPLGKQVDVHNNVVPANRAYVLDPSSTTSRQVLTQAASSPYVNIFGVRDGDTITTSNPNINITQDGTSCVWMESGTQVQVVLDYHGTHELIKCELVGSVVTISSVPLPAEAWPTPEPSINNTDSNMTAVPVTDAPATTLSPSDSSDGSKNVTKPDDDNDDDYTLIIILIIVGFVALAIIIGGVFIYRRKRVHSSSLPAAGFDDFASGSETIPLSDFDPVPRPPVTLHRI
eukprot:TRINITY_DN345_c0_g1_i12.p1 TRINITY_DN345_c0_g1~~TRINITY_DN345_c0_g1_i12.p1  ORF type:complete len:1986 (+),score=412.37 TRINITY_DN345_c0_g1_i12:957-6914(+)